MYEHQIKDYVCYIYRNSCRESVLSIRKSERNEILSDGFASSQATLHNVQDHSSSYHDWLLPSVDLGCLTLTRLTLSGGSFHSTFNILCSHSADKLKSNGRCSVYPGTFECKHKSRPSESLTKCFVSMPIRSHNLILWPCRQQIRPLMRGQKKWLLRAVTPRRSHTSRPCLQGRGRCSRSGGGGVDGERQ
jgi:hypothetical protein